MRLYLFRLFVALATFPGLFFLVGCANGSGSFPENPVSPASEPAPKAGRVSFRILPPADSHSGPRPLANILPDMDGVKVKIELAVVNLGKVDHPTATLATTVTPNDYGTAFASFSEIPTGPALGKVTITGGSIEGRTSFAGAIDVAPGTNTLDLSARGLGQKPDVLARVLEETIGSPSKFLHAPANLVNAISDAIPVGLYGTPGVYESAINLFLSNVGITYTNPRRYLLSVTDRIDNSNVSLERLRAWEPCPIGWPEQRPVQSTGVRPGGNAVVGLDPENSNRFFFFDITQNLPQPGDSLTIQMDYQLTAYETRTNLISERVPWPYSFDSSFDIYLRHEAGIESSDPDIKAAALAAANGETRVLPMAKKFFDFVIAQSSYYKQGGIRGASYLLQNKIGECSDYSALFCALCRASGIPARTVAGYWARTGTDQTHVWAEFYLPLTGWVPVDATVGQEYSGAERDYFFGNLDNKRIVVSKGLNITPQPALPDASIIPLFQTYCWWWNGSTLQDQGIINFTRTGWTVSSAP